MPDILVFYNSFALGIELKTIKGKPSPEQLDLFNKLQAAGIPVSICRSVDDVERTLRTYKIPLRKFSYAPQKSVTSSESRRPQELAHGAAGATPQAEGA